MGELADLADRRVGQRGIVGCLLQACRLEVVSEGLLQVAPAGDLAGKAVALAGVLGRGTRAWGNGRGWWSRGPPQDMNDNILYHALADSRAPRQRLALRTPRPAPPFFPREQHVFRIGPERSRARSGPLTAKTDPGSFGERERGQATPAGPHRFPTHRAEALPAPPGAGAAGADRGRAAAGGGGATGAEPDRGESESNGAGAQLGSRVVAGGHADRTKGTDSRRARPQAGAGTRATSAAPSPGGLTFGVTMALPGETEAGAGKQPCRGIVQRAHRDDDHGRGERASRAHAPPHRIERPRCLENPRPQGGIYTNAERPLSRSG